MQVGGTGNTSNNTTQIKTAVVTGVNYEGSSVAETDEDGAYPGWAGVQHFTISLPEETPSDAKGGKYTIKLTPNVAAEFGTDVKYEVYKSTSKSDSITREKGELNLSSGQLSREDTLTFNGNFAKQSGVPGNEGTADSTYKIKSGVLQGQSPIEIEVAEYDGNLQATDYYIVYRYTNTEQDQSTAMGKEFSAKVEVSVELAEE